MLGDAPGVDIRVARESIILLGIGEADLASLARAIEAPRLGLTMAGCASGGKVYLFGRLAALVGRLEGPSGLLCFCGGYDNRATRTPIGEELAIRCIGDITLASVSGPRVGVLGPGPKGEQRPISIVAARGVPQLGVATCEPAMLGGDRCMAPIAGGSARGSAGPSNCRPLAEDDDLSLWPTTTRAPGGNDVCLRSLGVPSSTWAAWATHTAPAWPTPTCARGVDNRTAVASGGTACNADGAVNDFVIARSSDSDLTQCFNAPASTV